MKNLIKYISIVIVAGFITNCLKPNEPPIIHSVKANPDTIAINEISELTCIAFDSDGDSLNYAWSSSDGIFPAGTTKYIVDWKAPGKSGSYTVDVKVTDVENISRGKVVVTVVEKKEE